MISDVPQSNFITEIVLELRLWRTLPLFLDSFRMFYKFYEE